MQPVPRWVRWTAHTVPLLTVPSGLWRLALGFGVPLGFSGRLRAENPTPGWLTLYVIALSAFAEGLALLTLGLVQEWGERVPRWIPLLGGRRIPTLAAAVPALLGATALMLISVQVLANWGGNDPGDPDSANFPHGGYAALMTACYAPLLLWGPLLTVVTVAYCVRRWRPARTLATPTPA